MIFVFLTNKYIHILIRSNEMQQYAGIYLLQNHSTCFGCLSHPSSGVHQTVNVVIKFKFQLNAQYFIPIVTLLYMFRAPLRPSSGVHQIVPAASGTRRSI